MKLLIHASLFASGTVEVDSETNECRFLAPPKVTDDQAILNPGTTEDGARAGLRALAALHKLIADVICDKVAGLPNESMNPTTNLLGDKGKASA